MKLKAVVFDNTPPALVDVLENIRPEVVARVLVPHLKVSPQFGPAEFYVQRCDRVCKDSSVPVNEWMCEVRLTGVSGPQTNFTRAVADFWNAQSALFDLYKSKIKSHIATGHRIQLFVIIMVDESIPLPSGKHSPLVEGDPLWIEND